jgi:hypothetical protein
MPFKVPELTEMYYYNFRDCILFHGAPGGAVEAMRYKPEGRGFDS